MSHDVPIAQPSRLQCYITDQAAFLLAILAETAWFSSVVSLSHVWCVCMCGCVGWCDFQRDHLVISLQDLLSRFTPACPEDRIKVRLLGPLQLTYVSWHGRQVITIYFRYRHVQHHFAVMEMDGLRHRLLLSWPLCFLAFKLEKDQSN